MKSSPEDCFYIFDSNVLLPQLGLPIEHEYKPFLSFLGKVVKYADTHPQTRILITDIQLSELFNKLLRYQARVEWDYTGKPEPDFNKYYKEHYRKSPEFLTAFESIKYDFEAIEPAVDIIHVKSLSTFSLLVDFDARKLDFNDHHLLRAAIEYNAIMVTNDKDFYGESIKLATYNSNMIRRYKNDIGDAARLAKQKRG